MSVRSLPDPEAYAHPRLSWVLECLFDAVIRRSFRIEHDVTPEFTLPPGCLLVSNHLRDYDGPILGSCLFRRGERRALRPVPFFVLREDLFQRYGLANLWSACPWPFNRLLTLIPLTKILRSVRSYPLRRVREFTWQDVLCELARTGAGDADPAVIFNARGRCELKQRLRKLPARVDAIDPWSLGRLRAAHWGWRRLGPEARARLAPGFRATVERQLRFFAGKLDHGHSVYFAPEGRISLDGRLGRIRAGACQLGRMTRQPMPVRPFALSYDVLGPGRTRVLVRHGELLEGVDFEARRAFADGLRAELRRCRVVTPSHLLAHFLTVRTTAFSMRELVTWMDEATASARAAGLAVDPLFERVSLEALIDVRVRWLARRRLVWPRGGVWLRRWSPDAVPSWRNPQGTVRYLANALAGFAPDYARTLSG